MRKLLLLIGIGFPLLVAALSHGQDGNTITIGFPGVPTGTCSFITYGLNKSNGDFYDCPAGTWVKAGTGGGGLAVPVTVPNGGTGATTFTAGQTLFGNGASLVKSSPGWYFASNPAFSGGADNCLTWNNAIQNTPAGSWIFWDIPGKLACASNPFASVVTSGTTFVTVPVSFWTTVGWVQPAKYNVYGVGESKTSEDGTQGSSVVACPAVQTACTGVFPNDTPLWAVISASPNTNFAGAGTSTQVWDFTFDCAYIQGCRSYMNYYGQEQTGAHHNTYRNCGNNGVCFDLGQSTVSGNSDNGNDEGINAGDTTAPPGATAACTYGSLVVRLAYPNAGSPGPKTIKDVTANHFQCAQLATPITPNHAIEVNGCCTDWVGKEHTEETSLSAIVFGTLTLLGTVNTSTTTATFVSGDALAVGCGGATQVYVNNALFTLSSCSAGGFVTTTSMGTQTGVPFSMDSHAGASNQKFETVDHCCSAFGTVNTSGTGPSTITFVTGQTPNTNWTGDIVVNSVSYAITSCTTTTCTTPGNTGTQTGVAYSFGSIYGIDSLATVNAISLFNFRALSPNPPSDMVADGFNATISRATDSKINCYVIDANDLVTCDDSGTNPINFVGGQKVQKGIQSQEAASVAGVTNFDILDANSTQHALSVNNNNTGDSPISRVACVNVTPVTVSANVATDQNLQACTLTAKVLNVVGRTLKIWTAGIYSTAASSTAQITIKAKLCSVIGCGSGTVIALDNIQTVALATVTVTNNAWNLASYSTTQTAGASSAYEVHGILSIDLGSLTTAADSIFNDINTATVGTIDNTVGLSLQITGAFSAASASNTMTGRQLVVEVLD